MDESCLKCLLKKQIEVIEHQECSDAKVEFLLSLIKLLEEQNGVTTAELFYEVSLLKRNYFGVHDDYNEIKKFSNQVMLEIESLISEKIQTSFDSILTAFNYALVGNIIDFAVVPDIVLCEKFIEETFLMISDLHLERKDVFKQFIDELATAKKIVYLTDNCGEIIVDKLFIKEIKKKYDVDVTVIGRGSNVINDATYLDLQKVGFEKLAKVISNGTPYAGTVLNKISLVAKKEIETADVILSKGQGNFETLFGCQHNIYYAFLCKCEKLQKQFNMPKSSGIFIKEKL